MEVEEPTVNLSDLFDTRAMEQKISQGKRKEAESEKIVNILNSYSKSKKPAQKSNNKPRVSHKFKTDITDHLKNTEKAGYPINLAEPEAYTRGIKNAKRAFDRALLNRGLEMIPAISQDQLDKIGNQSILKPLPCSKIGNAIYENEHQIETQATMGLLANASSGEKTSRRAPDDVDVDPPFTKDDDEVCSLRTLKLSEWEENIMAAFNNANRDVFYTKEDQINTILHGKKASNEHRERLSEIKNTLLSPLEGEEEYSINIPTIKRSYMQNFYRPAIPNTGERSCRNGKRCKVFQIYYQLLLSSKRELISSKWKDGTASSLSPLGLKTNAQENSHGRPSSKPSNNGSNSDLLHAYQSHIDKYKKQSDDLVSDKTLPRPEPLREFLIPKEATRRSETLTRQLAIFCNEKNAAYRNSIAQCKNRSERVAVKEKTKKEIEAYLASINHTLAEGPPNPCILCELAETARLARNCSNNSPIHNPDLNVVTQRLSNLFDDVGEYASNYQLTCGGNFHRITKPILDFNVNNYLPSSGTVAYAAIEVSFSNREVDKSNFFALRMQNKLKQINTWSEQSGMLYTIEDSILKMPDSM